MPELVDFYKKELENFLTTLSIFKSNKIIVTDKKTKEKNRCFIKEKFIQIKSGNVNEAVLDIALDELIPYLYEKT